MKPSVKSGRTAGLRQPYRIVISLGPYLMKKLFTEIVCSFMGRSAYEIQGHRNVIGMCDAGLRCPAGQVLSVVSFELALFFHAIENYSQLVTHLW